MKKIKLFSALLVVFFVASCSSDDNSDDTITPVTITNSSTVDFSSFNANQTDITSLVTIGGQPANLHTTTAIKGDEVRYSFNISNKSASSKQSAKVTRELVLLFIDIDNPTEEDRQFLDNITYTPDPNNSNLEGVLGFKIGEGAPEDYDSKFDMYFAILEDGTPLQNDYIIDPKIKIRVKR